jgi:predicted transcriptional regulator
MVPERIRYLLASTERVRLLEALTDGPVRQCTLRRECSLARSTVHRNLTGCADRGWVVETDEGYVLTQAGERLLAAYREFADTARTLAEHDPALERLHGVEEALPTAALGDCRTTAATGHDPHAPTVEAAAVVERNAGDPLRVALGGVSPITTRAIRTALAAGSELEVLLDEGCYGARGRSDDALVEAGGEYERLDLRLSPTPVDAGVVLGEETVCVLVRDERGSARAALTGPTRALGEWAGGVYRRLREGAVPVEREATAAGER